MKRCNFQVDLPAAWLKRRPFNPGIAALPAGGSKTKQTFTGGDSMSFHPR
jgi:hypothetical protein